ncbi:hypothetical protein [Roseibium alexandrii]
MADEKQIESLKVEKLELIQKLREIRAEMAKVNSQLARSGAHAADVVCW